QTIPIVFATVSDPVASGRRCAARPPGREHNWLCHLRSVPGSQVASWRRYCHTLIFVNDILVDEIFITQNYQLEEPKNEDVILTSAHRRGVIGGRRFKHD